MIELDYIEDDTKSNFSVIYYVDTNMNSNQSSFKLKAKNDVLFYFELLSYM